MLYMCSYVLYMYFMCYICVHMCYICVLMCYICVLAHSYTFCSYMLYMCSLRAIAHKSAYFLEYVFIHTRIYISMYTHECTMYTSVYLFVNTILHYCELRRNWRFCECVIDVRMCYRCS